WRWGGGARRGTCCCGSTRRDRSGLRRRARSRGSLPPPLNARSGGKSARRRFLGADGGAVEDVGAEVEGDVFAAVEAVEDFDGGAVVAAELDRLQLHVGVLHRGDEHLAGLGDQRVGGDEWTRRAAQRDG